MARIYLAARESLLKPWFSSVCRDRIQAAWMRLQLSGIILSMLSVNRAHTHLPS